MDSSLKLFCSWVLLMTQPLRLLGNNSGNLSTATTPITCYYRAALLSTKSVIDIWPLKKGFKVFCIILFLTLSGTEKLEKKPDLLCHCMPSLMPYFRSSKSDIQSFFYESISVLQQDEKVDFCNLPELYWQFNTNWYRKANKYRSSNASFYQRFITGR